MSHNSPNVSNEDLKKYFSKPLETKESKSIVELANYVINTYGTNTVAADFAEEVLLQLKGNE